MQRFTAVIVAAAVLVGLAVLIVAGSPPPETPAPERSVMAGSTAAPATGTAARAAASPPAVALQQVGPAFDQPLYATAPRGDTSRLSWWETGVIRTLKDGRLLPRPFLDISSQVSRGGEQGLLSMAFDPGYATNRRFYVNYTNTAGDTRVVRYRASAADPDLAVAKSPVSSSASISPTATTTAASRSSGPTGDSGSAWATAAAAATPATRPGPAQQARQTAAHQR